VQAALNKQLTKPQDILVFVKSYLVENATNFKCDDILTANVSIFLCFQFFVYSVYVFIKQNIF